MLTSLSIENVPDHVVDRLRLLAKMHHRSLQAELLAMIEDALLGDSQGEMAAGFAEERQRGLEPPREGTLLEAVFEQVRNLSDERQQEIAEALLAYLDEPDPSLPLTPEQIAEIERRAADDGPYATDEEVREVFARLTK